MDNYHQEFMRLALKEALKAAEKEEVPVGAVLVSESGSILAATHNQTISLIDPTGHAEILALREAAQKAMNYRLLNTTLYVTVEPCIMCMGAIIHARVSKVVFGAPDLKWGAAGSLYHFANDGRLNHRLEVVSGILQSKCKAIIQDFFRAKRNSNGNSYYLNQSTHKLI